MRHWLACAEAVERGSMTDPTRVSLPWVIPSPVTSPPVNRHQLSGGAACIQPPLFELGSTAMVSPVWVTSWPVSRKSPSSLVVALAIFCPLAL